MRHLELLKQSFRITWRYRALWIFGFLLALCSGGGGSGGGGNFNFRGGMNERDFKNFGPLPDLPKIDPSLIIGVVIAFICLILLLVLLGIVVRAVTRTALISMVYQVQETRAITVRDGWRFGWSGRAWRVFLVGLLIGIPLSILSLGLILLALSPLLLILVNPQDTALIVITIILTILALLFVILILIAVSAVIMPLQELAWRQTTLAQHGVIDSVAQTFGLIKRRFKDVAILWLLMLGVGLGWGILSLLVVLPTSLIAAALLGGIPGVLTYLLSGSWIAALIIGGPLGLLALILVASLAQGLYLTYQSTVWTLTYLELQKPGSIPDQPLVSPPASTEPSPTPEPVV